MKRRVLSLSSLVFAVWLASPMTAFGQPLDTAPDTVPDVALDAVLDTAPDAWTSPPASIPAELSAEARAQYEAQMKTLRAQIDAAKWQEALATAEAMNKERPREPQARFLKTLILTELGRNDEAERELLSLVSDYPELPEPRNNLATLYAKRGEYDLARRELELALTAVPNYGIAHANLADLYLQQAIEHYRRAAALTQSGGDSRALLARAGAVQTLLAPTPSTPEAATPPKDTDAAKEEKDAAKDEKTATQEHGFLSAGCEAPPELGDDDDVFSGGGGTCELEFDEPPTPEKKERGDQDQGSEARN